MRVLLAVSRYPWPARRGDQLRALQFLDFLAGEHDVTLLAPAPDPDDPPPPVTESTRWRLVTYERSGVAGKLKGMLRCVFGGWPLQSALFEHADLRHKLRELAPRADLVILQLSRLAPYLDAVGDVSLWVDLIDSLWLNFERRARVDRWWLRPLLRFEAHRLLRAEARMLQRARGVWVVSERDRRELARRLRGQLEEGVLGRLQVLPLAFPLDASEEVSREEKAADATQRLLGTPPTLALTGNLGYFVNVDAFCWFLDTVWPPLQRQRPELRLCLAGARPAVALRRAAVRAGVEVIDTPPDLKALLAQADVALAPMRCGSGQPLKILEAWQMGVPVVASPWAAAGTSAVAGEDLLLAGPADEWVRTLLDVLEVSPGAAARRATLVRGGRERLRVAYGRQGLRQRLLQQLCAGVPGPT